MTDKNKKIFISGAGSKGGGDPELPSIAEDNLNSEQFVAFLDLLSEGEIEGFPTPSKAGTTAFTTQYLQQSLQDVFFDNTSAYNAQGTPNFNNVIFDIRFGQGSQPLVPNVTSSANFVAVNAEVNNPNKNSLPGVVRTLNDPTVTSVKILITFPILQRTLSAKEENVGDVGDIVGSSVQLGIDVQYSNESAYTNIIDDTVSGRSADPYQKEYKLNLTGAFPVNIRVRRATLDADDTGIGSDLLKDVFIWSNYGEIIDDPNTYPNSAYAYLRLGSENFSSVPQRKYRLRGIKTKIPAANATGTPTVDIQTGRIIYPAGYVFNGTLGSAQWNTCPAMALIDLLLDDRYGFGAHIKSANLDLFSFVSASQYSNELVNDGQGGLEARFACNLNIQKSTEAYDLINAIASIMRCVAIWSGGKLTLYQDKPTDSTYLYNLSNVSPGGFNYSGTSLKTRSTRVAVSFFNMETQKVDYEEVINKNNLESKLGVIVKRVQAFGCTSRGQARRFGENILFSEEFESEVITFTASLSSGILVRPGNVVEVNDPVRSGVRRGGKIIAVATAASMTVDDTKNTDLPTDASATLSVILPDGSFETRGIAAINQDNGVVTLSAAFSQTPNVNTEFVIETISLKTQKFRVVSVEEVSSTEYTITGIPYFADKYNSIEAGVSITPQPISILNQPPEPPGNISALETIVEKNGSAVSKLIISFSKVPGVVKYIVSYKYNSGNFITQTIISTDFEIFNTTPGTYTVNVTSLSAAGKSSVTAATITIATVGKTANPGPVLNLTAEPAANNLLKLKFDKSVDIDVIFGGFVVCRHSPDTTGAATFGNSTALLTVPGNSTEMIVPSLDGEYSLKFIDDGGRFSTQETSIIVDAPEPIPLLGIQTRREDLDNPSFQGNKTSVFNSASQGGIILDGTFTLDGVLTDAFGTFDNIPDFDIIGPTATSGTYEFANLLDLGAKFDLTLKKHLNSTSLYPADAIDGRFTAVDLWTDWDGEVANDVDAQVFVASTDLDPSTSTSATYTQSATTITITKNSHGYTNGSFVQVDFTSGNGVDGYYEIKSKTENTFVLTASSSQTTNGNCTYGPEFSTFNILTKGIFKGRAFKFKCELTASDPAQNIVVKELGYQASFEPRFETSIGNAGATNGIIASGGVSSKAVTFQNPFFVGTSGLGGSTTAFAPSIGITLQNAQDGDFFTVHTITGTGFEIDVKNGNNFVNRNFTFSASGFGKGS